MGQIFSVILFSLLVILGFQNCQNSGSEVSSIRSASQSFESNSDGLDKSAPSVVLYEGEKYSRSGVSLKLEMNGNLVLSDVSGKTLWESNTKTIDCVGGCRAEFQSNGNLVLYRNESLYWSSESIAANPQLKLSAEAPYISIESKTYGLTVWRGDDVSSEAITSRPGKFLLHAGGARLSKSAKVKFATDGNLSVTDLADNVLWSTQLNPQSCDVSCVAVFQFDGSLELFNNKVRYWSSNAASGIQQVMFTNTPPYVHFLSN